MAEPTYFLQPHYCHLPEKEIIARCQAGDLEAFNVLISRYESRVLNMVRRFLRNEAQAVDEAQEIFIKVFRKIKGFKGDAAFSTWLYRVTSNHCLNYLESQRKKQRHHPFSLDDADCGRVWEDPRALKPDEAYQRQMQLRALATAIDAMPRDQRQAMILYYFECLKYEEIAEIMEKSVTMICSSLHRGRQRLKKLLANPGGGGR